MKLKVTHTFPLILTFLCLPSGHIVILPRDKAQTHTQALFQLKSFANLSKLICLYFANRYFVGTADKISQVRCW